MAGVVLPAELPPLKRGYEDGYEDTRSAFETEIGVARRRNRYRVPPRTLKVTWERLSQELYDVLYDFYYLTLQQGAEFFDVQLALSDYPDPVWLTVQWVGDFTASSSPEMLWTVEATLRAVAAPSAARNGATDQLEGLSVVAVGSLGTLLRAINLGGVSEATMTAEGRLGAEPLRGDSVVTITSSGRF